MQKKHRPPSSPGSRATVEEAEEQVTGRRDRAKASPFKMESPDFWGLAGSNTDTTKISAEFIAPCYCITLTSPSSLAFGLHELEKSFVLLIIALLN
ncbi:pheophorbide a oxygenase, chloroplastic-like isoform X2 [Impatiens glandulifera]|uniref:pheophorbide a oxygenase, chloroplastic-like isoform X2 n=1 Tax=Impatiens glandulifera TaxID=253017 RepID=UPI001FB19E49|nr:pheophorbide a oxygenase, chloroplastic-like isoform X2 [Impatiens glandulifera]